MTPFDVLLILVGLVVYFVPSYVAHRRQVANFGSILVLNIFLGWSLIGWAVALAMALRDTAPKSSPDVWRDNYGQIWERLPDGRVVQHRPAE